MERAIIKQNYKYHVYEDGRVENRLTHRFLKSRPNNKGYLKVDLYWKGKKKTHYLHRLVAQAFILNPENKPEVNHKDKNIKNNHKDNLEWSTRIENLNHRDGKLEGHEDFDLRKNPPF